MSINKKSPPNKHEIRAWLARARLHELRKKPLPDRFDVQYLKEVHRYIFQDFPFHGLNPPHPGRFRPEVEDWIKQRSLKSIGDRSIIAYSNMGKDDIAELHDTLHKITPASLRKLKTSEFAEEISKTYAKLDYIHPFLEGNSRTLREFTRQIAKASGYKLAWEKHSQNEKTHDLLYIARDRDVGELSLRKIKNDDLLRAVVYCMDRFKENPSLTQLVKDATRPYRAIAFEKLPEKDALKEYPELAGAFKTLHVAEQYFQEKLPDNQLIQQATERAKQQIINWLDTGEAKPREKREAQEPDKG